MQSILEGNPGARLRVLVVWEPVLWSDVGPPTSGVMGRIPDTRARQFWDERRLLSDEFHRAARHRGEPLEEGQIVWDVVAAFPPGVSWGETLPEPAYAGFPVVDAEGALREHLSLSADGATPGGAPER